MLPSVIGRIGSSSLAIQPAKTRFYVEIRRLQAALRSSGARRCQVGLSDPFAGGASTFAAGQVKRQVTPTGG
jgi:hypothetical protein